MCGIAGIVNFGEDQIDISEIKNMMLKIKHRGPDDEGTFIENKIGLGFVRLSIIDLSEAAHQPMFSDDDRYVIVFNGEIYNYIELREELINLGVSFRSKSDTEVLLKSYLFWGEGCLNRFNGMWAFVIYDRIEKNIFASRDRFGVKPFYYHVNNERFLFASEIPAILRVMKSKPIANKNVIFDYLVFNRTDQNESTFFKDIHKLKPGHSMRLRNDNIEIKQWYDLRSRIGKGYVTPEEYRNALADSIKLRLRSDVPIGVCFSGGLDSSAIVSLILKNNDGLNLNTFSAVYSSGTKGDESIYIQEYSNMVSKMHYVKPDANSLFKDLDKLINAHAEPISSTSPYAQFKVMELASKSVKVTLDGQGADEQLAGYHYFFGIYFKSLFIKLKWFKLVKEIVAYRRIHKSNYVLKTFIYFLLPSHLRTNLRAKEKGYIAIEFFNEYKRFSTVSDEIYNSNSIQEASINHFNHKLEHLLKWEDRNSMRFGIEARTPFLDYRLVEQTLGMEASELISNGKTKFVLRNALKEIMPSKILNRQDKVGFETPEAEWFRTEPFKSFIYELINSNSFQARNLIVKEKALVLFNKHIKGEIDISKEIWKWVNLEMWYRNFID